VTAASDVYVQDEALQTCIFRLSLLSVTAQASTNVAVSATSFDTGLHKGGGSAQRLAIMVLLHSLVHTSTQPTAGCAVRVSCGWEGAGSTHPRPHCGDAGHAERRSCSSQCVCGEWGEAVERPRVVTLHCHVVPWHSTQHNIFDSHAGLPQRVSVALTHRANVAVGQLCMAHYHLVCVYNAHRVHS
jgi:hypothetical protein